MKNKDEEEVLVVETDVLFPDGIKDGLHNVDEKVILKKVKENGSFLKRKFAETDPSWQQIIPQISLIVGQKIFIHRIPSTTSEKRLEDMWPIFLGGHVNNFDGSFDDATKREFEEEIDYKGKIIKKTFMGMIKKTGLLVNEVHTGLVWVYEGDSEEFRPTGDSGISEGRFIDLNELDNYLDKMSYWSQIAAPVIKKVFSR